MDINQIAKEQHEALKKIRELLKGEYFKNVNLPHGLSLRIFEWLIDTNNLAEYYTKWLNNEKIER